MAAKLLCNEKTGKLMLNIHLTHGKLMFKVRLLTHVLRTSSNVHKTTILRKRYRTFGE